MSKKEDFKEFVKTKPELVTYVKDGKMTWQKFYEIYDLYGNDDKVWDEYKERKVDVSKINDIIKNVDISSVKEHINTAQKALDIVQELTSKVPSTTSKSITPLRPINKFFED